MKKLLFSIIVSLVSISMCDAQLANGELKGTITTKGDVTVPFVKIFASGTSFGTESDFDGLYSFQLKPGNYTIVFREAEHNETKRQVEIKAGEPTVLDVKLTPVLVQEGVTVVADKIQAESIGASLQERAEDDNTSDVVSAEQIANSPVNDAAGAVQQAPGVSVVDGKEVYVRGLGDRYTKTILNSMEIPGLDPDRNTVQMDIFPSNIIANITVYKTFTPDLQGDFTGGIVDIETKDYESRKTTTLKAGFGYNTAATFNKAFILYDGGKLDFLAFDDGSRALPIRSTDVFPDPTQGDKKLESLTRSFNQTMSAQQQSNFLNQNYSFSNGNSFMLDSVKRIKYGYNAVINYRNNYRFFKEARFNEYLKSTDRSNNELFQDRSSVGQIGENEVTWSGMFAQSLKFNKANSFSLVAFHTQNAVSSAAMLSERNYESNQANLEKTSLQFTQRSVSNVNLSGKHSMKNGWDANWKVSPTYSTIKDPDIRSTVLEVLDDKGPNGETQYALEESVGAGIRRIFRDLTEYNASARFDLEKSFKLNKDDEDDERETTVKFGAMNTFKKRNFEVFNYVFRVENQTNVTNNPDDYFASENIWTPETDQGTYGTGERELENTFSASQNVAAGYVMNTFPITEKFGATYGVRVEKADSYYTGENADTVYTGAHLLNELDLLPSINLKYVLRDTARTTMQLRASYSKTVARPSFKEKSISRVYDPIQGRRYNGNLDLLPTDIHNADVRWEFIYGMGEVVSVSGFYKRFINPIEIASFDLAPEEVKPVNAGVANLFGLELEMRKLIAFGNSDARNLFLGTNITFVKSQIDMDKVLVEKGDEFVSERELRQENARDGEVVGQYRSMFGQSPYIVNAYLNYDDTMGVDVNLSYNVQGDRLAVVGVGRVPDVYEKAFHSLNLKISKSFGKNKQWKFSMSGNNLLNNSRQKLYRSFNAEDQIYEFRNQGINISSSITLKL